MIGWTARSMANDDMNLQFDDGYIESGFASATPNRVGKSTWGNKAAARLTFGKELSCVRVIRHSYLIQIPYTEWARFW